MGHCARIAAVGAAAAASEESNTYVLIRRTVLLDLVLWFALLLLRYLLMQTCNSMQDGLTTHRRATFNLRNAVDTHHGSSTVFAQQNSLLG
jgi:hypothetical protein